MKKNFRRLSLNRETLRALEVKEIPRGMAGSPTALNTSCHCFVDTGCNCYTQNGALTCDTCNC
jgi:hypothetical protein